MKKICLALFTLATIASASRAIAVTGNYVYMQAAPVYAIPGNNLEVRSGVALALGVSFDENQEIELEGIAFNTEFKATNSTSHSEQSDLKFKHLLATYRYVVPVSKSFRVFAGLSAGMAHVSYEVTTVDRNVIVTTSAANYSGWTSVSAVLAGPNAFRSSSILSNYPSVFAYNPSDGTLTQRFSGSNTVAAGGPQLGFEHDWDSHSTIAISAKWLYMAKTDVTKSGGIAFVQAAYRYSF